MFMVEIKCISEAREWLGWGTESPPSVLQAPLGNPKGSEGLSWKTALLTYH